MNKGFKCSECRQYIVPPQIYDEKKIKLCHCDEIAVEAFPRHPGITPMPVAPEYIAEAVRLAALDDLKTPFVPAHVPILISVPKIARKPILERLAGVFIL